MVEASRLARIEHHVTICVVREFANPEVCAQRKITLRGRETVPILIARVKRAAGRLQRYVKEFFRHRLPYTT
jgi:ribose 1,5-bisphosphokinase PhnN